MGTREGLAWKLEVGLDAADSHPGRPSANGDRENAVAVVSDAVVAVVTLVMRW